MEKQNFSKAFLLRLSLLSLFAAAALMGCATNSIPLNPNAEKVNVIEQVNASLLPTQGCKLSGQVIAKTITPYKTDKLNITANEMNIVKNQASALGANTIVFTDNKLVYDDKQTTHLVIANAYFCEPSVMINQH